MTQFLLILNDLITITASIIAPIAILGAFNEATGHALFETVIDKNKIKL